MKARLPPSATASDPSANPPGRGDATACCSLILSHDILHPKAVRTPGWPGRLSLSPPVWHQYQQCKMARGSPQPRPAKTRLRLLRPDYFLKCRVNVSRRAGVNAAGMLRQQDENQSNNGEEWSWPCRTKENGALRPAKAPPANTVDDDLRTTGLWPAFQMNSQRVEIVLPP